MTEDSWKILPGRIENGSVTVTPPVMNLPTTNSDPWAPQTTNSATSPVSPGEDEFAAISHRNASTNQNGL